MEYVNYKKIHRHKTRKVRLTIVEWPGGSITLEHLGRVTAGTWSGASMSMSAATAKRIMGTFARIFASRRKTR